MSTAALERATSIICESLKQGDVEIVQVLVKGFIVGIANMEMQGPDLDPQGREILEDIYAHIPGLEQQMLAFMRD